MLTRAQAIFESRVQALGRQGQIYIVPTLDGLKLLALNLILLVIGLVYANNYVLLFNFILFCLFIGSMFYTHFNLQGLQLTVARLNPLHVNESGAMVLNFKTRSALGHHFLNATFKNAFISSGKNTLYFSLKENSNVLKIEIPVHAQKRGVSKLHRLCIETRFPFHLFRAFIYFDIELNIVVYPERTKLDLHETLSLSEEKNDSEEEHYLRTFQPGDPLKRIHWKKFAQTGNLLSKQLASYDKTPVLLGFSREDLSKEEKEKELSSICFGLYKLHSQNIYYGLALDKITVEPGLSQSHLAKCLKALAEYET